MIFGKIIKVNFFRIKFCLKELSNNYKVYLLYFLLFKTTI